MLSTTGDKLKNGLGSTTIFARVYRSGVVIEDENTTNRKFDYTWTMFDQNGHKVTTWGNNTGKKTTPSITVTAAEITNRATFFCEVTEK